MVYPPRQREMEPHKGTIPLCALSSRPMEGRTRTLGRASPSMRMGTSSHREVRWHAEHLRSIDLMVCESATWRGVWRMAYLRFVVLLKSRVISFPSVRMPPIVNTHSFGLLTVMRIPAGPSRLEYTTYSTASGRMFLSTRSALNLLLPSSMPQSDIGHRGVQLNVVLRELLLTSNQRTEGNK